MNIREIVLREEMRACIPSAPLDPLLHIKWNIGKPQFFDFF